jgi:hypothetical protein
VIQVRQDVPGEQVIFGGVRVAGQDEGLHAQAGVAAELGQDLARVPDKSRARTGAGAADPGPQVRLGEALVISAGAQLVLPGGSC